MSKKGHGFAQVPRWVWDSPQIAGDLAWFQIVQWIYFNRTWKKQGAKDNGVMLAMDEILISRRRVKRDCPKVTNHELTACLEWLQKVGIIDLVAPGKGPKPERYRVNFAHTRPTRNAPLVNPSDEKGLSALGAEDPAARIRPVPSASDDNDLPRVDGPIPAARSRPLPGRKLRTGVTQSLSQNKGVDRSPPKDPPFPVNTARSEVVADGVVDEISDEERCHILLRKLGYLGAILGEATEREERVILLSLCRKHGAGDVEAAIRALRRDVSPFNFRQEATFTARDLRQKWPQAHAAARAGVNGKLGPDQELRDRLTAEHQQREEESLQSHLSRHEAAIDELFREYEKAPDDVRQRVDRKAAIKQGKIPKGLRMPNRVMLVETFCSEVGRRVPRL